MQLARAALAAVLALCLLSAPAYADERTSVLLRGEPQGLQGATRGGRKLLGSGGPSRIIVNGEVVFQLPKAGSDPSPPPSPSAPQASALLEDNPARAGDDNPLRSGDDGSSPPPYGSAFLASPPLPSCPPGTLPTFVDDSVAGPPPAYGAGPPPFMPAADDDDNDAESESRSGKSSSRGLVYLFKGQPCVPVPLPLAFPPASPPAKFDDDHRGGDDHPPPSSFFDDHGGSPDNSGSPGKSDDDSGSGSGSGKSDDSGSGKGGKGKGR